jgi:hypothetical protein
MQNTASEEDYSLIKTVKHKYPELSKHLFAKRYSLPEKVRADYIDQDKSAFYDLDNIVAGYLAANKCNERDESTEEPSKHRMFLAGVPAWCTFKALQYSRPTLFLEKSLGEVLLKSGLPKTLRIEDIHFLWEGFAVMVPKGLFLLSSGV